MKKSIGRFVAGATLALAVAAAPIAIGLEIAAPPVASAVAFVPHSQPQGCSNAIVNATTLGTTYYHTATFYASGCGPLDVTALLGYNGGNGCKLLGQYYNGSGWVNGAVGWINFAYAYSGNTYLLTGVISGTPERISSTTSCSGIQILY